uniref:(northern house mosquito) hypothetical protein n=1 Tax=Culex pipiens TaxID=7175 RepID=A0A8D8PD85_CULPI
MRWQWPHVNVSGFLNDDADVGGRIRDCCGAVTGLFRGDTRIASLAGASDLRCLAAGCSVGVSLSGREDVAVTGAAAVAGRLPRRVRRLEVEVMLLEEEELPSGPLDRVVLAGILRATRGAAVADTTPRLTALTAGSTDLRPLAVAGGTTDLRFATATELAAFTAATAIDLRTGTVSSLFFTVVVAVGTATDFRRNWTSCSAVWFVLRISRSLSGMRRTAVDRREIGDATRFCRAMAATFGMSDFRTRDLRREEASVVGFFLRDSKKFSHELESRLVLGVVPDVVGGTG